MPADATGAVSALILAAQGKDGCWNTLPKSDPHYPELNYYAPTYSATIWTLLALADMNFKDSGSRLAMPLETIAAQFFDKKNNIYSLGKTHFPIPCLNGNMLYLHSYFGLGNDSILGGLIDFFDEYQRFDDGGFKTPSAFPYCSNKSCYGKHTCYWGIIKLFKGLSFIPQDKRTDGARRLISKCADFILLHEVCYGSRDASRLIHKNIGKLTFPNMYQGDFLEILWLLSRESVRSPRIDRAVELLKSKMRPDGTWSIERKIQNMAVPLEKKQADYFITERAREALDFHGR